MRPRSLPLAAALAALAALPAAAQLQPSLVTPGSFTGQLMSVTMPSNEVAVAVGYDGVILRTHDGGQRWWRIPVGVSASLDNVTHVGTVVTVVGGNGTILRATDGGVVWTPVFSGVTSRLKSVSFADAANGVAVGDSGTVIVTRDGGLTWTRAFTGVSEGLIDVRMFGPTVIAVGRQGVILRSDDGGATWRRQSAPTTQYLTGVWPTGPQNATVVGLGPVMLFTADGGNTWSQGLPGTTYAMSDVHHLDAARAVAVGSHGVIVRSTDGGRVWQQTFLGDGFAFEDVAFADELVGMAVGSFGMIMRTADGGQTWTRLMGTPSVSTAAAPPSGGPTLVPTGVTGGSLFLEVLGMAVDRPGGTVTWSTGVGTASNGNRMDELRGTGPGGQYFITLTYRGSGTCADFLAGLLRQEASTMRNSPPYLPINWYTVAVERRGTSSYVCLPLASGLLVAGFTAPDIATVGVETVRPALFAVSQAAIRRWGRAPSN